MELVERGKMKTIRIEKRGGRTLMSYLLKRGDKKIIIIKPANKNTDREKDIERHWEQILNNGIGVQGHHDQ